MNVQVCYSDSITKEVCSKLTTTIVAGWSLFPQLFHTDRPKCTPDPSEYCGAICSPSHACQPQVCLLYFATTATAVAHHRHTRTFSKFSDQTNAKEFPDFSRFSRWLATQSLALVCQLKKELKLLQLSSNVW